MLSSDPLYLSFIASLVLAIVISLVLAGYIFHRRNAPAAPSLLFVLIAVFFWAIGYLIEYTSDDLTVKLFSFNISYIGTTILHPAILFFCLQYCGHGKWVTKKNIILLAIIPVITLILQWTKEYHTFMYYDISMAPDGPFLLVMKQYGPWFWVTWVYDYMLLISSIVILVRRMLSKPYLFTRQIIYIIMMIIIPVFANVLYITRFIPMPHADWTPPSLSVVAIFMALMVYNRQLLDVIPIARESLIETMSEGFIVTDRKGYIVDFNNSAMKMIGGGENLAIGNELPSAITDQLHIVYDEPVNKTAELILHNKDGYYCYITNISPVYTPKHKHVGHLFIFHDITERKQAEDLIKRLAYFDQLTTLPNRYLFHDRATMAMERAVRHKSKLAVIMLDLDKFKDVNDTLGHEAGDKVLQEVASRLAGAVRKVDTVSRFGGDEFIILLTEITDNSTVNTIIERMESSLSQSYTYQSKMISLPYSIGIAVYPDNSDDLDQLIRNADAAMYKAKRMGHNRCCYYSPETK